MKAGKKGRQVIFHNWGMSPFYLSTALGSLGTEIFPAAFFQETYGLTKRDNIKEDVR
jgi:hypothetical protein